MKFKKGRFEADISWHGLGFLSGLLTFCLLSAFIHFLSRDQPGPWELLSASQKRQAACLYMEQERSGDLSDGCQTVVNEYRQKKE